jgi:hypothetical protein
MLFNDFLDKVEGKNENGHTQAYMTQLYKTLALVSDPRHPIFQCFIKFDTLIYPQPVRLKPTPGSNPTSLSSSPAYSGGICDNCWCFPY